MSASAFDPTVGPSAEDITGIGVRIGTVASVLSSFYAAAPTAGLIENLRNSELLDVWPLRDETSLEAVDLLRHADDRSWDLHAGWHELFGFSGPVRLTRETTETQHDDVLAQIYRDARFSSEQVAHLPQDHCAKLLGLSGHLSTQAAMDWRNGVDVLPTGEALSQLIGQYLAPLGYGVVDNIEAAEPSATFLAIADLTRGYLDQVAAYALLLADAHGVES